MWYPAGLFEMLPTLADPDSATAAAQRLVALDHQTRLRELVESQEILAMAQWQRFMRDDPKGMPPPPSEILEAYARWWDRHPRWQEMLPPTPK